MLTGAPAIASHGGAFIAGEVVKNLAQKRAESFEVVSSGGITPTQREDVEPTLENTAPAPSPEIKPHVEPASKSSEIPAEPNPTPCEVKAELKEPNIQPAPSKEVVALQQVEPPADEPDSQWRLADAWPQGKPPFGALCPSQPAEPSAATPAAHENQSPSDEIPMGYSPSSRRSSGTDSSRSSKYDKYYHQRPALITQYWVMGLRMQRHCRERKSGPKASKQVMQMFKDTSEGGGRPLVVAVYPRACDPR